MPNWCMNNVTINGSKEKLEEIIKACENDKFLEFLVPIGDWDYGSAIEAWGTKWEVHNVDHDLLDDNTLMLNFDSAWGPPVTAYNTGEANHDITIYATYYEPGMALLESMKILKTLAITLILKMKIGVMIYPKM